MNNLCAEIGFSSLNKYGEELCGDCVEVVEQDENSTVIVLADGLGSGVKAHILSTLTSKIISTMMANLLSLEECVKTIAATLPVRSEHGVAYSTFTIIRIVENEEAEVIQYDNPHVILIRDGKNFPFTEAPMEIDGKLIYKSKILIQENDIFLAFSDGVPYAGPGMEMNYNWKRDDIISFMEILAVGEYTAKTLATILLDECDKLYEGKPGDDTTVCALKIRKREPMNLLMGPPSNNDDLGAMLSLFFAKAGKHIVCGGTTSSLVASYLRKPLMPQDISLDPDIPPTSTIDGVDLVTEGVITINKVLVYAEDYLGDNRKYTDWAYQRDGASMVARLLFEEATDINIFVGKAINPAYQDLQFPMHLGLKIRLVEELAKCLKQMGKRIKVNYF